MATLFENTDPYVAAATAALTRQETLVLPVLG